MPEKLRILTLCTGWDSKAGGVATANRELSIALAEQGHHVTARVANQADPHPLVDVRVITPPPGTNERTALALNPEELPKDVDVIIGHSRFSGPAAQELRERYPNATVVHFMHMNVEELDRFRGDPSEAHRHFQTERDLVANSHVAVGVGPVLHSEVARLAQMSPRPIVVHEYIPGIPGGALPSAPTEESDVVRLHMVGRTDDPQKGAETAARAVKLLKEQGSNVELSIRGTNLTGERLQQVVERFRDMARGPVAMRPFTTDAAELRADLLAADVVLMPSQVEGWGLVAAEAAGHGVPVMVSEDSGFGSFLLDERRVPKAMSAGTTIPLDAEGRLTPAQLASALQPVVANIAEHKQRARQRREFLLREYNSKNAAEALVQAVHKARAVAAKAAAKPIATKPIAAKPVAPAINVVPKKAFYLLLLASATAPTTIAVAQAVKELRARGHDVRLSVREPPKSNTSNTSKPPETSDSDSDSDSTSTSATSTSAETEKELREHAGSIVRVLPPSATPQADYATDVRGADAVMQLDANLTDGQQLAAYDVPFLVGSESEFSGHLRSRLSPELVRDCIVPCAAAGLATVAALVSALEPMLQDRDGARAQAAARSQQLEATPTDEAPPPEESAAEPNPPAPRAARDDGFVRDIAARDKGPRRAPTQRAAESGKGGDGAHADRALGGYVAPRSLPVLEIRAYDRRFQFMRRPDLLLGRSRGGAATGLDLQRARRAFADWIRKSPSEARGLVSRLVPTQLPTFTAINVGDEAISALLLRELDRGYIVCVVSIDPGAWELSF